MAITDAIRRYVETTVESTRPGFYVPRYFRSAEDWDKWSHHEWRGHRFGNEPSLSTVLQHPQAVILGEPGAGKSTIIDAAVEAAADRVWVPLRLKLREYKGELSQLLADTVPEHVRADLTAHPDVTKIFLLDGFDEVPADLVEAFVRDIAELHWRDPSARIFLTSRQAFFVNRRELFADPYPGFYLLGLDDDDIAGLIEHEGVSKQDFYQAATRAQLAQELANPFALGALLSYFKAKHDLGDTRSDVISFVIDQTLASRPTSNPKQEMQALRLLALAMEMAARNELLADEAQTVLQTGFGTTREQADTLLDELAQSILVRTQHGYVFQMRSYGEYLAASELAEVRDRDRLLEPIFLLDTRDPHDSWRNAVSYLVERNKAARIYFSRHHPDWLLNSSPRVFSDAQRDDIVRGLLSRLAERREYLTYHPIVRASDLARFVTPNVVRELIATLAGTNDDVELANGILLLGMAGERAVAGRAFTLAVDPAASTHLRHSALNALDRIGSSEMVPTLLDIADWNEPTTTARLDTAAALMAPDQVGAVLQQLSKTDTLISSAFYRFREFRRPDELESVLDAALKLRPDDVSHRLDMYLEKAWQHLAEFWQPEWAPKVRDFLLGLDPDRHREVIEKLVNALAGQAHCGAPTGRLILEHFRDIQPTATQMHVIAKLITLDDVRGFQGRGDRGDLLGSLRAFGAPDVKEYLYAAMPVAAANAEHQRELSRWQRKHDELARTKQRLQTQAQSSTDGKDIFEALWQLEPNDWPDLSTPQRAAVTAFVERTLNELDLPSRIVWEGDHRWTIPNVLPPLLRVIDRYELRLTDDRQLAQVLRAREHATVARYAKRFGLSPATIGEVERLVADVALPDGALDGVLGFVREHHLESDAVRDALQSILLGNRSESLRKDSLQILTKTAEGREVVARQLRALPRNLAETAERALVEGQHRPTIERLLSSLLADPQQLAAGNVEDHFHHPFGWIAAIRHKALWPKLARLRRLALEGSLQHVATIVTSAMAATDPVGLSKVILEQVESAPSEWQPFERIRALEYERDGKIRAAQSTPFEKVLDRLQAFSTMTLFKLWVEGPKDIPALEVLVGKLGIAPGKVIVQSIGGWAQVLSDNWRVSGLGTGCSDFSVWLDGDRARDWATVGHPIRPDNDIRAALKKFTRATVEYHILERYAVENYFPTTAFESVLKRPLAGITLDPVRSIESQLPDYSKSLNGRSADATDLDDLQGTDLGEMLEDLRERVAD